MHESLMDPEEQIQAMADNGIGGAVSLNFDSKEDKALAVRFLLEPVRNEAKSKEAGRLVCDEVEFCEIRLPGSTDVIRNVVSDVQRGRFSRQYAAFKNGQDQDVASGTPLKEWPIMTRSQVEEARYLGVRTVEALAQIPDTGIQRLGMGWNEMRQKARDWLIQAKDGSALARLRTENEEMRARLATLEEMLSKQAAAIQAGTTPAPAPVAAPPDPRIDLLMKKLDELQAEKTAAHGEPAAAAPAKKKG